MSTESSWKVIADLKDGRLDRDHRGVPMRWKTVRHVIAEADTGYRYSVVVTKLGEGVEFEGGDYLVSVISPGRSCYPFAAEGLLTESYVEEKFQIDWQDDLTALTMTIGYALGREVLLS